VKCIVALILLQHFDVHAENTLSSYIHAALSAAAFHHKESLCTADRSKLQPKTSFAVTSDSQTPDFADATQFSMQ